MQKFSIYLCIRNAQEEQSPRPVDWNRETLQELPDSYRDLKVWQCSMKPVLGIYATTAQFPKHELYGLVSLMRRAAVSVPSNIAEGEGRLTDRDRAHFYLQSRGSLLELETQILIAQQLNYICSEEAEPLLQLSAKVGKMLNALVEAIAPHATHRPQTASAT
jgi:four helix bundle protein